MVPDLDPQDITCTGSLKFNLGVLFDKTPVEEDTEDDG
jgi:hypothetical protein